MYQILLVASEVSNWTKKIDCTETAVRLITLIESCKVLIWPNQFLMHSPWIYNENLLFSLFPYIIFNFSFYDLMCFRWVSTHFASLLCTATHNGRKTDVKLAVAIIWSLRRLTFTALLNLMISIAIRCKLLCLITFHDTRQLAIPKPKKPQCKISGRGL